MKPRASGLYTATKRVDGKKIFAYGRTPEEAKENLKDKLEAGLHTRLPTAPTLYDIQEQIWEPHINTLAPLTKKRYLGVYARFIHKTLGNVPIGSIKASDVRSWLLHLEKHKVSPYSRKYALSVLSQTINAAFKLDLIDQNPCQKVSVSVKKQKRERILTVEECKSILEKSRGTSLSGPVYLAMMLGLRRGEIAGLKWSDLDRDKGELRIVRQRQAISREGVTDRELKTDGSKRTLYLPSSMIDEIVLRCNFEGEYVCMYNGLPWVPDTISEHWGRFREEWGLSASWRFHDLRHLAAGLIYAATNDLLAVQAVLGHANPDMTMLYAAIGESRRRHAIQSLSDLFSRQTEHTTTETVVQG